MKKNEYGEIIYSPDEIIQFQLNGHQGSFITEDVEEITKLDETSKVKSVSLHLPTDGISVSEYHDMKSKSWAVPSGTMDFDIKGHLLSLCEDQIEIERVHDELILYEELGLLDILRLMKYIVDTLRDNNVLWGVGRGSSVSSYCLYLLGVHKVNSIKYELDIHEFLRKEN